MRWGIPAALLLLVILAAAGADRIVEWLWMRQLGYTAVFWRILWIRIGLFAIPFAVVFLFLWLNLRLALSATPLKGKRVVIEYGGGGEQRGRIPLHIAEGAEVSLTAARIGIVALSLLTAYLFGSAYANEWDAAIRFFWGGSFGSIEPIFRRDVGFYVFRLPFHELLQNGYTALLFVTLFLSALLYFVTGRLGPREAGATTRPGKHLSILFLLFLAGWAWGYYLDLFGLLFDRRGVVYGVGYTDYHVVRIGIRIMLIASVLLGALVIFHLLRPRLTVLFAGIGVYFVGSFVALTLVPGLVQRFSVVPNELELERPFLVNNIEMTRRAFGLGRIEERDYQAVSELTYDEIAGKDDVIRNIRLWDWRPILQTFQETQAIRLYYQFYEVDVDRYVLGDGAGYRQVMLAARELVNQLPEQADTWVNRHLQFTHGYGLAMSFVSEAAEEGLPVYLVKNLPPESEFFEFEQAAVYYGEKMTGFRIVDSLVEEFDYPKGPTNVYVNYRGKGGVPLDGFWKRLLFAWHFSDINFLLSDYIGPQSQVQFWRRVRDRVSRISPFLPLDRDPYLVADQGRLFWIQDAYTTSSGYPYSEPSETGLNYIRNPVKIVVDAYHGTVLYYVIDPSDPIVQAYRKTFPALFKDFEEMPPALRRHIRYPQDIFMIQAEKFRHYHMTVPQVFYNQEDLWAFPKAKYAAEAVRMEPYYILTRLPGEEELQYILILPFVPENRENMIAWMAAKCDPPDYGQVVLYKLPKQYLTYGPMQIEAVIDQDDFISQQLTLWDQRGSRVVRGNLIVIPVDSSFLYVEPVFIIAEGVNIPQLKRVIMVYGKRVVMEPTIDLALRALFAGGPRPEARAIAPASEAAPEVREIPQDLRRRLEEAERSLERAMEALREALGR